jgi:hypothetical protein
LDVFVWEFPLEFCILDCPVGNARLETFAWDFRLEAFAWELSVGDFRLGTFAWKFSLENFRLGTSPGKFCLEPAFGNFSLVAEAWGTGLLREGGTAGRFREPAWPRLSTQAKISKPSRAALHMPPPALGEVC